MAFTHQGALEWSYSSPTTVQHDMAPMLKVGAGSGPCGSWPDLLLVGWADGAFTALHPSNGTLHWQANSNVSGWGITGASLIEGDDAVIPTRNGLMRLCMASMGHSNSALSLEKVGATASPRSMTPTGWGTRTANFGPSNATARSEPPIHFPALFAMHLWWWTMACYSTCRNRSRVGSCCWTSTPTTSLKSPHSVPRQRCRWKSETRSCSATTTV